MVSGVDEAAVSGAKYERAGHSWGPLVGRSFINSVVQRASLKATSPTR
jgi:hypothetical protein